MKSKGWMLLITAGLAGLLALPALAQPGVGPGWMYGPQPVNGQPLSMARAEAIARQAVAQSGIPGLVLMHIMEFSNNFYVAVKDKATGEGAFELLVDRYTGVVRPEPQSMMWNTKYGHMAGWGGPGSYGMMGPGYDPGQGGYGYGPGMMRPGYGGGGYGYGYGMGPGYGSGGPGAVQSGGQPLTLAQARVRAQQYLDVEFPGTRTDEAITFPGYYTIDVARDGHPIGMLSVNAYTGAVWYHVWHGAFIAERDLD
ncbi:MAG TPA: hypothetical protein VJT33_13150 [bacterium]|nr:hypothetical protein [bacterium]